MGVNTTGQSTYNGMHTFNRFSFLLPNLMKFSRYTSYTGHTSLFAILLGFARSILEPQNDLE